MKKYIYKTATEIAQQPQLRELAAKCAADKIAAVIWRCSYAHDSYYTFEQLQSKLQQQLGDSSKILCITTTGDRVFYLNTLDSAEDYLIGKRKAN